MYNIQSQKNLYLFQFRLVEDQIDIHWSYINTKHADFKADEKLLKLMQTDPAKAADEYQRQRSESDIEEDELETNNRGKICAGMNKQDKTNCRLIRKFFFLLIFVFYKRLRTR